MAADVIERAREMRDQERQIQIAREALGPVQPRLTMHWRVSPDVYADILRYGQDERPPAFRVLTRRLFSWTVDIDESLPPYTLLLEPIE